MPAWKNITLDITKGDLNSISEKISEINRVLSITITDKIKEPNSKWFDEDGKQQPLLGETHLMKLLTSASVNSDLLNNDIRKKLEDETISILKEEIFEDRDWIQHSKNQFREIKITDTLQILPPWVVDKNENGTSIIIDPGSGFGTGSHPTTQLCLRWIEKNNNPNSSLIDYGCGSGILSIAANKFGYARVVGVDNDHQALLNAERNKDLNSSDIVFFHSNDYDHNESYDITVANILLNTIISLRETLVSSLKENGILILSGILEEQASDIIDAFKSDIFLSIVDHQEGWLLMKGKKINSN